MECDWWSFGAIRKIVHWKNHLKFLEAARLTAKAKDLILRLLCDVEHKLDTLGASQIKAHLWFKDIFRGQTL